MHRTLSHSQQMQELIRANTQSMIDAFRLDTIPLAQPLLQAFFRSQARQISDTVLGYNASVSHLGLSDGSRWLLDHFSTHVQAHNSDVTPHDGGLLVLANHPGMTDAMAIFATLSRSDIKIVARPNPILSVLSSINPHLIFVSDNPSGRIGTFRQIRDHLRRGGTVLMFPAGQIEPDPALHTHATATLPIWSESIRLLAKQLPELQVMPVAVGGVISRQARRHPIARLYHTQARQDWVAATLMIMHQPYRHVTVNIHYGDIIYANDMIMGQVQDAMLYLYQQIWHDANLRQAY